MSNIKVDLKPLFEKLETKSYSVIKLPSEFPDYKIGSDLDIFCYDVEDQEWYGQRPDKIKHIEYLEEKIKSSEININNLLDKLHYYTELPKIEENRQVSSSGVVRYFSYLLDLVKKVFRVIKEKGLKETLRLIIKKVKK
jgi:hypothetical protein